MCTWNLMRVADIPQFVWYSLLLPFISHFWTGLFSGRFQFKTKNIIYFIQWSGMNMNSEVNTLLFIFYSDKSDLQSNWEWEPEIKIITKYEVKWIKRTTLNATGKISIFFYVQKSQRLLFWFAAFLLQATKRSYMSEFLYKKKIQRKGKKWETDKEQ